jgi:hypothetical protein
VLLVGVKERDLGVDAQYFNPLSQVVPWQARSLVRCSDMLFRSAITRIAAAPTLTRSFVGFSRVSGLPLHAAGSLLGASARRSRASAETAHASGLRLYTFPKPPGSSIAKDWPGTLGSPVQPRQRRLVSAGSRRRIARIGGRGVARRLHAVGIGVGNAGSGAGIVESREGIGRFRLSRRRAWPIRAHGEGRLCHGWRC